MKRKFRLRRGLCILLCLVTALGFSTVGAMAKTASQLNSEIAALQQKSSQYQQELKELKAKKADQQQIQKKLQQQIDNTQAMITLCTNKIATYTAEIAKSEAEIEKKTQEMEEQKFLFRQRIRSIYMTNTNSTLLVLLGSKDLSDYLARSEVMTKISAHDSRLVDDIKQAMHEIEVKKAEIEEKSRAQVELKQTLSQQRANLQSQMNEINSVIRSLNADQSNVQGEINDISKNIKALQNELSSISNQSSVVYDGSQFTWPVPGIYRVVSGFGGRSGGNHYGIDISASGIMGHVIVAAADGVVLVSKNPCTHNYGKSGSCGCGGGYGNYVMIDHGNYQGSVYRTLYGHMTRTACSVGQHVKKGQVIGYVGTTGWSTGPHLHFEVIVNGAKRNPMNFFNKVK